MAVAHIQNAFTSGEVSPSLYGRPDLAKFHVGAATMRNLFVGYRGGAYSRAGTAFVGFSKQTGRAYPPRMIGFQFNINQGLGLEFGNYYMRVVSNGAFVTEPGVGITAITNANPGVLSLAAFVVTSATANNGSVSASYAPNDILTMAGGTFTQAAALKVLTTTLLSVAVNAPGGRPLFPQFGFGGGYVPGCLISLAGGTQTVQPQVQVLTTKVVGAIVSAAGSGGTTGTRTMQGTTGSGTPFQASVSVAGGHITAILSITVGGSYTVNPTNVNSEPVTDVTGSGSNVTGARLTLNIGVATVGVVNGGVFTGNPPGGNLTQSFCSAPNAAGATFNTALFGPNTLSVSIPGVYSVFPTNPASGTGGAGVGATFNLGQGAGANLNAGDWTFLSGIGGMTQLNGETVVLTPVTSTTYSMADVYGNPIDTTGYGAYTSGGTAARIFTLQTPYAEADLPYLKFTESADAMSLCLVNQQTLVEYQSQDLTRVTDTNWTFTPSVPAATVSAPTNVAVVCSNAGGSAGGLSYKVTAVNPDDGTESIASARVDVALHATYWSGVSEKNTITWNAVPKVRQYNVYRTEPSYGDATIPIGGLYGFIGSAYGCSFIDVNNIVADFTQTPPQHRNPFARGQVLGATVTAAGSGYSQAGTIATITTATGSGAIITPIIVPAVAGTLVGFVVDDPGANYLPGDTIAISGGGGSNATATLNIGALTGTYPGVASYIQERRAYAYTLNNPDTYFITQPGAFTNMDVRIPTIESDAIIGSPWAVQVNGIQFMVPMPGGLIAFTGLGAWQLTGNGGSSFTPQPIGPSTQQAQPQGYNGCSPTVPPIKIESGILYVQSKGSIYREVNFNISSNQYAGDDITVYSSHLFTGYTIKEHAWCEEPYKVLWAVRNDGLLLSCTYLKAQQVLGWARHDTDGLFQSVCAVTELPVDALYCAVQRFPGANTAYMIERMDNRIWADVESTWCVDAGKSLAQPTPAAILTASSASGLGAISGVIGLVGGTGYSAGTTASVIDQSINGRPPRGTGAVAALTIIAGVITAVTISTGGQNYANPIIVFSDPAGSAGGSGASAMPVLDNSAIFTASANVFAVGNVGNVIRMGGGIATIIAYTDPAHVTANITSPIVQIVPNTKTAANPGGTPQSAAAGSWSMTAPVTAVSGLKHLAGATVTGLADGVVIPDTVVSASGGITLPGPASSVVIGLGYHAQLQSLYPNFDQSPTDQGQRKKVPAVTIRVEASRGLMAGSNQVDSVTLSPAETEVEWTAAPGGMTAVPDKSVAPFGSSVVPLYTGDVRVILAGGWQKPGQVAVEQRNPLPMNILAFMPEVYSGDTPQMKAPTRQERQRASPVAEQGRAA